MSAVASASRRVTNPWGIFAVIGSAMLLASLNFSLVFVAFGDIVDTFDVSEATVSWALTGFSITLAAMLIPAGWLADRYGRRPVLGVGVALFVFGSAIIAVAPTVLVLVLGRVLQAVGLALESSASFALLLDAFPVERRSTAVGALGATGGLAASVGPVVGGVLVDTIGWRWTFALNVPIGLAILVLILTVLPIDRGRATGAAPDLLGTFGLVLGVGAVALAIVQTDSWGLLSAETLSALAIGLVAMVSMVRRSSVHPDPILYLPLFAERQFRRGSVLNLLIGGSFAGGFLTFITMLTDGWDLSRAEAGLAVAIIPAIGGPLSIVSGRIADRHGHRWVIVPGAVLIAVAGAVLAVALDDEPAVWTLWLPIAALYGAGVGLAHAACHAAAMRDVTSERLGVGGAMSRIFMEVGAVVSVALAVALVTAAGDPIAGTKRVCLLLSIVGLVGAALALRLQDLDPAVNDPGS